MPRFENATLLRYLRLSRYENLYSKLALEFQLQGDQDRYLEYLGHKRRVYIEKQCVRGVLRLERAKRKAATAGTVTATA
ncbi:hypothetical protein H1D32_13185 [Anaerobacillus sp. CMMVII]|uniref:hypothetical protein n=1 Tax=Anaerobacillus sp. CMMVII TaxID=2755588 RepID=UPI0021B81196|nr:hypothetical protein [Anaerobacillus sp. CMMVII]MCT8138610.1 hypothetical protein [Anaerobacillus sp. CMMVII]